LSSLARNGRARMTSEDEPVSLYYRSPRDIRNESFTHRRRGLDENEVREYLDLLADQMEAVEWERRQMFAELERLRARDDQVREHPRIISSPATEPAPDGVQGQAAVVLSHAQEVADQLLDDASRRAQEVIAAAQRQGHDVVRQARVTTLERMQSLYDELDGRFHRMDEAIRPSAQDLPPLPPRDGI
jgi:DivIVA domain-containing protein